MDFCVCVFVFQFCFTFLSSLSLIGIFFCLRVIYLLVYLFFAVLGLCCSALAFSSCAKQRLHFVVVCRLLLLQSVGSRITGFSSCSTSAQQLWHKTWLPMACGIFLEQRSNWHPLHWQADSLAIEPQGKPWNLFLKQLKNMIVTSNREF